MRLFSLVAASHLALAIFIYSLGCARRLAYTRVYFHYGKEDENLLLLVGLLTGAEDDGALDLAAPSCAAGTGFNMQMLPNRTNTTTTHPLAPEPLAVVEHIHTASIYFLTALISTLFSVMHTRLADKGERDHNEEEAFAGMLFWAFAPLLFASVYSNIGRPVASLDHLALLVLLRPVALLIACDIHGEPRERAPFMAGAVIALVVAAYQINAACNQGDFAAWCAMGALDLVLLFGHRWDRHPTPYDTILNVRVVYMAVGGLIMHATFLVNGCPPQSAA